MNKNKLSPTGIMATFANIISYEIGLLNKNENVDVKKDIIDQVKSFKTYLEAAEWNPTVLTAEELRTIGALRMDPNKDIFFIPPWIVEFLPEDFDLLLVNTDPNGENSTIKVKDVDRDKLWRDDTSDYGVTKYAMLATNESKFDANKGLMFYEALKLVMDPDNAGFIMRLPNWQPDVYIKVQWPDENSKMSHPYFYVTSRYGCVPWKETYPEMFATSWEVYQEDYYKELVEEMKKQREAIFKQAMVQNSKEGGVDVEQIGKDLIDKLRDNGELPKEEKPTNEQLEEVDK